MHKNQLKNNMSDRVVNNILNKNMVKDNWSMNDTMPTPVNVVPATEIGSLGSGVDWTRYNRPMPLPTAPLEKPAPYLPCKSCGRYMFHKGNRMYACPNCGYTTKM